LNRDFLQSGYRDLVRKLYFAAKAEGIPMTKWLNRLVDESLREFPKAEQQASAEALAA